MGRGDGVSNQKEERRGRGGRGDRWEMRKGGGGLVGKRWESRKSKKKGERRRKRALIGGVDKSRVAKDNQERGKVEGRRIKTVGREVMVMVIPFGGGVIAKSDLELKRELIQKISSVNRKKECSSGPGNYLWEGYVEGRKGPHREEKGHAGNKRRKGKKRGEDTGRKEVGVK